MVDNVLIMAGGAGTRLWPASVRSRPKQFMDPGIGRSLLRATVDRAAALEPRGRIIIVTHRDHVAGAVHELSDLDAGLRSRTAVLAEPVGRNTAPAIAFGLAYLAATEAGGEAPGRHTTLILAADHLISPTGGFIDAVEKADRLAREEYLVTFGVTPTRPETGYGYIQAGEAHEPGHLVAAFTEKPDRETAEAYLAAGGYFWNSGMFVFPHATFFDELRGFHPEIAEPFAALDAEADELRPETGAAVARGGDAEAAADTSSEAGGSSAEVPVVGRTPGLEDLYAQLPSISIDYALMEKSRRAAVVEANFTWSDIGSWDEVAKLQEDAAAGDHVVSVESGGNMVLSDMPVALCGVEDLIVVQRNGKLLICRRGESQLVKQVVAEIKEAGREDWL
jgi:mannose-1-phosphate guanylyltransferase